MRHTRPPLLPPLLLLPLPLLLLLLLLPLLLLLQAGPLFWVGTDMEHATQAEYVFGPGAQNHILVTAQTEEAAAALTLNGTLNVVAFNALLAFWDAAHPVAAEAHADRPTAGAPGPAVDLAYRVYGLLASGGRALLEDSRYSVPAGEGLMSGVVAVLNSRQQ